MSSVSVLFSLLLVFIVKSAWGVGGGHFLEEGGKHFSFRGVGEVKDEEQAEKDLLFELEGHDETKRKAVQEKLSRMYPSLPKNEHGNLGHQAVRYALHRYFMSEYGWFIRGLEPEDAKWTPVSLDDGSLPHVMNEWVPNFLQKALEARVGGRGVDLHDLSAMASVIYGFIDKEALDRIELCATVNGKSLQTDTIDYDTAAGIFMTYLESMLSGGNFDGVISERDTEARNAIFLDKFSMFPGLKEMFDELLKGLLSDSNGYEDMIGAVREIGIWYGKYMQGSCLDIQKALKSIEGRKPGRVRLSAFYNMSLNTQMEFIESAEWLESLGELDTTDPGSPQVIISNYLLGRQNCADVSSIYTLCCQNACENFMSELEIQIGAATATYEVIAQSVASFTTPMDPVPREFSPDLLGRLQEVAELHGGKVPLHSRLFAQWMHHAFPLECPFPHEPGSNNPQTFSEWVQEGRADATVSEEARQKYVDSDTCAINWEGKVECAQESTDLPWSMVEEHLAGPDLLNVSQPSQSSSVLFSCGVVVLALGLALLLAQSKSLSPSTRVRIGRVIESPRYITLSLVFLGVCALLSGLIDGSVFAVGVVGVLALNVNFRKKQIKKCDDLPVYATSEVV